jgi:hypothetical protein
MKSMERLDAIARRGTVRHRAKVVEYRVRQHRAKLGDRLKAVERASLAPPLAEGL